MMYRTYSTSEENDKSVYPYEERLIPKEVAVANQSEKEEESPKVNIESAPGGLFQNMSADDLIVVGILIFLIYEGCDDWLLIIALLAILFIR